MSGNRSVAFAGIFGCVLGAMIPLVLGAAQAPEPEPPKYSVIVSDQIVYLSDHKKNLLHAYRQARGEGGLELTATWDISKGGEKTIPLSHVKVAKPRSADEKGETRSPE